MRVPRGLSRIEQETFFRASAADDVWEFYTRDPVWKRLLKRRGYEVREDHQGLWVAEIPLRALTVRSRITRNREYSVEERERRQEAMRKLNSLRNSSISLRGSDTSDSQADPEAVQEIGVTE